MGCAMGIKICASADSICIYYSFYVKEMNHLKIDGSLYLSFCILNLVHLLRTSITLDTITPTQSIRDGDTLASAGRRFQMGFFSPDNSKSRYVGIWYTVSSGTVVWVANRDTPLNDHSRFSKVTVGVVILLNRTNSTVWSSNTSRAAENPVLQLLDNGNLVVKDSNVDDRSFCGSVLIILVTHYYRK